MSTVFTLRLLTTVELLRKVWDFPRRGALLEEICTLR